MQSGLDGLDHVIVAVRDLEEARARVTRMGFTVSPRGRHIGWGTANYCVMLERDYIELLGIVDPEQFTAGLDRILAAREGLTKVIAKTRDAGLTHAFLAGQGFEPQPVQALARAIELEGGDDMPRFRLVHVPPARTPGLDCFACEHLTPGLVWRPAWTAHANGATGLASVWIKLADPADAMPAQARMWGAGAVELSPGRLDVDTGAGRILFADPEAYQARFPEAEANELEAADGTPLALEIATASPKAARSCLTEGGLTVQSDQQGLSVPPGDANGVRLAFIAA